MISGWCLLCLSLGDVWLIHLCFPMQVSSRPSFNLSTWIERVLLQQVIGLNGVEWGLLNLGVLEWTILWMNCLNKSSGFAPKFPTLLIFNFQTARPYKQMDFLITQSTSWRNTLWWAEQSNTCYIFAYPFQPYIHIKCSFIRFSLWPLSDFELFSCLRHFGFAFFRLFGFVPILSIV